MPRSVNRAASPARYRVCGWCLVGRGSPSVEVTVSDGSGRAVAVFLGRRRLHGLDPGRGVVLEGVARKEGNRTVLLNPPTPFSLTDSPPRARLPPAAPRGRTLSTQPRKQVAESSQSAWPPRL